MTSRRTSGIDWTGAGWGLPLTTAVLTPSGWTSLGDLRPGASVIDGAGTVCRVRTVRILGHAPTLHMNIADGSSIEAAVGHPWMVEVGKGQGRRQRLHSTASIRELRRRGVSVRLVRTGAVSLPANVPLPLEPYLLGVLLGDGAFSSGRSVTLWTCENEIRDLAEQSLPSGARFSSKPRILATTTGSPIVGTRRGVGVNPVLDGLRELGLAGRLAHQKFVPEIYKWSPVDSRLALLQGLLDTDGCAEPAGQVSFSSSSQRLAEDVVFLVRSLGGRCSLRERTGITYTSPTQAVPKSARDSYKVGGICLPQWPPFRLSRKAARVRTGGKTPQWTVRSVDDSSPAEVGTIETETGTGLIVMQAFLPVVSGSADAAAIATTSPPAA